MQKAEPRPYPNLMLREFGDRTLISSRQDSEVYWKKVLDANKKVIPPDAFFSAMLAEGRSSILKRIDPVEAPLLHSIAETLKDASRTFDKKSITAVDAGAGHGHCISDLISTHPKILNSLEKLILVDIVEQEPVLLKLIRDAIALLSKDGQHKAGKWAQYLEETLKKMSFVCDDAHFFDSFENDSVHALLTIRMFDHLDTNLFLENLRRILLPGGEALIHSDLSDLVPFAGKKQAIDYFTEHGFEPKFYLQKRYPDAVLENYRKLLHIEDVTDHFTVRLMKS